MIILLNGWSVQNFIGPRHSQSGLDYQSHGPKVGQQAFERFVERIRKFRILILTLQTGDEVAQSGAGLRGFLPYPSLLDGG